ncbi:MAG: transcriptional regulator [Propionibacteriaceae bacterium]|jgi:Mn-dependent DtxR family transcriptional regulator|nr:transcriptional regulator [Propionibacteriaceae bacterium]
MATKDDVLQAFASSDKPLKSAEVAALLSVDKPEVDKAIKALKAEGKLVSPKVCFYTVAS